MNIVKKKTKFRVKKGDLVQVMTGDEKGARGTVLKVLTENGAVLIGGVNTKVVSKKPSHKFPEGGLFKIEAPVHISNVMVVDSSNDLPTKIAFAMQDGKKVRICKRSKVVLNSKSE